MSDQATRAAAVGARFGVIHARLSAGAEPQVEAVLLESGAWRVRWGVDDGGVNLDCSAADARKLADVMEGDGYFPRIPPLLRLAADLCDAKSSTRQ